MKPTSAMRRSARCAGWLALLAAAWLLAAGTASAAIAYRSAAGSAVASSTSSLRAWCTSNNGSSGTTSLALSTSSGTCSGGSSVTGDVLIAQVAVRGSPTITPPSGWTLIGSTSAGNITQAVYWRVAAAASTSGTWSFSTSQRAIGAIASFANVDAVSPVDAFGGQAATSSSAATAPAQSQTDAGSMVVALFSLAYGGSSLSTPTGMTGAYDVNSGSGSSGITLSMDTLLDGSAGSTGNKNATAGNAADNIGQLLVLRPATRRLNLAVPAGSALNDVMVATVAYRDSALTIAAPLGWTQVNSATQPTSGTNGIKLTTYYRVATAAEPSSYAWTFSGGNFEFAAGGIASFSGVDTAAPINASAAQAAGTGSTYAMATPSITPTSNGAMLVASFTYLNADTWTAPTGFSEVVDVRSPSAGAEVGIMLDLAYKLQTTAAAVSATATAGSTYSQDYGATQILALKPAASGPDHYELSLPSASLACLPSTVTVTACSNSSSPCTSAATTVSGATATLATSGATLGAATVTFNASGVASTTLSYPGAANGAAVSVTLSGESIAATNARQCCPNGSSCSAASSCSTTFSTAGFVFAASAGGVSTTLPAQTAGTASGTYYLRAVKTGTATQACEAAISGAATVNWAYECDNPTTCSGTNLMSIDGGTATTIQRNNNGSVGSYTPVPMSFDANGNAPFSFTFGDVGQATLWVGKTVNSAALAGTSNAFVTKPARFAVSAVQQTASPFLANPAAASAAGSKFVKAGESFSATVTAQTSGGAATPNFGRETSPEGVLLTPALVLPAGGAAGTLSNAGIGGASFSGGVATVTNLSYSEVGIVTLTPSVADGDYLGAGGVSGSTSGNIGRFVPANFALGSASVTHRSSLACSPASAFGYLGENFRLAFTLTARNLSGGTTQNYTGSFAKLDPTSAAGWNLAGRDGTTVFSTASGRLALGTAAGSWSSGVASGVTLTANATRGAAVDGPFNAAFGIAPADSDGVAMSAFDMASSSGGSNDRATVGSVALRFGRLRLANAIGAADRTLALPAVAQSWSGSAWDTNTLDSCTTVPTTAVNFGNPRKTLTAADLVASSGITLAGGVGTLRLAAPGGGRSGTVDVALALGSSGTDASCLQTWTPTKAATAGAGLAHLRGAWCGSSLDKDPAARATFGLQRTQDNLIYRRENY